MANRPELIIGKRLKEIGLTVSAAESCTGGLFSSLVTDAPGSSEYFLGSIVAYDNAVKTRLLSVKAGTLKSRGAVSRQTAVEMAEGVRKALSTDIGVAITGIAGPGGGSPAKPVGTVFICVVRGRKKAVKKFLFKGGRKSIKRQSAGAALELLGRSIGLKEVQASGLS